MVQNDQKGRAGRRIRRYSFISLLVFIVSLLGLFLLQQNYQKKTYSEKDVDRFERVLHAKEELIREEFESLDQEFSTMDAESVLNERFRALPDTG